MLEMARLDLSAEGRRVARDPASLHRLLMLAFPAAVGGRAGAGLLYRQDTEYRVLAQYTVPADWDAVGNAIASVAVTDAQAAHAVVREGDRLRFLLHANPTFDAVVDGKRRRTGLRDPGRQLAWLDRKFNNIGAVIAVEDGHPLVALGETWRQRARRGEAVMTHQGVAYRGVMEVRDPKALGAALRSGIGRGRAYGFGLLTVAR